MNLKKYSFITGFIHELMFSIIIFSAAYAFLEYSFNNPGLRIKWLSLLILPCIAYIIRWYSKKFYIYIIFHTILFLSCFLAVHTNAEKFVYIICFLFVLINSLISEFSSKPKNISNMSINWVLFILLTQLIYNTNSQKTNKLLFFILVMAYSLLYFLNKYLLNFKQFLSTYQETKSFPLKEIKSSNNLLVICFFIIALFVTILLSNIFLNLKPIRDAIIRFIMWLLSLLKDKELTAISENYVPPPGYSGNSIFNLILLIILVIITIVLTINLVMAIYRFIINFYQHKNKKYNTYEFISPFPKIENISKKSNKHFRLNKFLKLSNSEKIRKAYYTFVIKNSKGFDTNISPLTPTEINNLINAGGSFTEQISAIDELTYYYEKARYSPLECSKNDVIRVNKLIKQL